MQRAFFDEKPLVVRHEERIRAFECVLEIYHQYLRTLGEPVEEGRHLRLYSACSPSPTYHVR